MEYHSKTNIAQLTAGTQSQVFTGAGVLKSITINTASAWTVGVIDGTSGAAANVATIKSSTAEGTLYYDCIMANGCRIANTNSSGRGGDITVTWMQG